MLFIDGRNRSERSNSYSFLPLDEFREQLDKLIPWSSTRFDSAVDPVRSQSGARLIHLVWDYADDNAHLLCIEFSQGDHEIELLPVMAQI